MKFIGLVGTNSKRSTNRQLLQYIQKHFADKADIELVEIKDLPVFNKPANKQLPESVLEFVPTSPMNFMTILLKSIISSTMLAFSWLKVNLRLMRK